MHLILRSIKLVRTDTRRKTRSKYEVTEIVHDCEQETHIIVVDKLLNRTSKPKLFGNAGKRLWLFYAFY